MRFRIARVNLLVGVRLLEPFLLLPKRTPDVFDSLHRALSGRHQLELGDMTSAGGNSYSDLKLTINVFHGRGRIEITPAGFATDLRDLVREEEDLKVIRDFLVTTEQAFLAAVKSEETASTQLLQREFRANLWIDCEGGREAAHAWLRERGEKAMPLGADAYPDFRREFTLQIDLVDRTAKGRIGVGIQRSQVPIGHLYLACEHVSHRTSDGWGAIDANLDKAYADMEGLLRSLGLEGVRDNT
jgi:hypothetical protein